MSNVTLNAGSGGATLGTDTVTGTPNIDYQVVKLSISAAGVAPTTVSASNPLPDNLAQVGGNATKTNSGNGSAGSLNVYLATDQPTLTNAQPVLQSGSWTVTANLGTIAGAATAAKQPALGTAGTASADVISVQGVASMTPLKVDGSGVTQPVSGTFWQATQPVSGTFWQATQPVSAASLPLPSGASTAAKQPALGTAGTASSDVITVQGIASMTALKVDGSAVTQPVSGTFWQATQPVSGTVTANAGTGNFNIVRALTTSGGASYNNAIAPATPAVTTVKASAGNLYGIVAFNLLATPVYLKFYDASSVTLGTTACTFQFMVPGNAGGAGFVIELPVPRSCANAIKYAVTNAIATTDNTGITANSVIVDVAYN